MFNILIIEDNPEKLREILQLLSKIDTINIDNVDSEPDSLGAKNQLKHKSYDLLILDIAIPLRKSENIDLEGGLKLLKEIQSRRGYIIPTHIIGLTGRDELLEKARKVLGEKVLSIIHYSNSDIEWQTQLLEGIKQRIIAKDSIDLSEPEYDFDVVLVCALKTELEANRNNGWQWENYPISNDDTNYYKGVFLNNSGSQIKIIAAKAERMGMPATAALTMKVINKFKPKYVMMTGIMAGVTGKVNLGDIVVPSPVWDWGSGKWEADNSNDNENKSLFTIDPFQFSIDRKLSKEISLLSEDSNFLFNLRKSYGNSAPKTDITVHIGPVATGASVLSDKATFDKIKDQHRKLLGVEMEAYGLFSAAEIAPRPKPMALCIKSVVDFGDSEKSDDFQDYGAFTSAQFVKEIIQRMFK